MLKFLHLFFFNFSLFFGLSWHITVYRSVAWIRLNQLWFMQWLCKLGSCKPIFVGNLLICIYLHFMFHAKSWGVHAWTQLCMTRMGSCKDFFSALCMGYSYCVPWPRFTNLSVCLIPHIKLPWGIILLHLEIILPSYHRNVRCTYKGF